MNMLNKNDKIKSIEIHIADSNEIESWSSGEVTKPETINYKTHKPERNGLFDEKIFGPIKDYRCPVCGKKHKRADAGKKCSSCGETIIESKMVRRRKMGHIKLATPISHIWFSKVDYSVICSLIGLKQDELDSIIYFKSHIVYDKGSYKGKNIKDKQIIEIQNAPSIYRNILLFLEKNEKNPKIKEIIRGKTDELIEESKSTIGQNYGIDFYEYNNFIEKYSDIKIGTGAEIIKKILEKIDLKKEKRKINNDIQKNPDKSSNFRRIKVIESFIKSNQKPSSLILDIIPIIPADLRPLIQLDGGRHSTVDINELYRRIIIRNNRLKHWLKIGAPDLIIKNEKRMLQESVDALFDNTRKKSPVVAKDNRILKSLSENLKGKQGRFRQNLLGKRVDYSGRSVIVVGPELKLNQVGLPKQMIVKLFEPFIVNLLVQKNVVKNIKQAKKMIELFDNKIWKYADRVIKNHTVLLNRAPTLHRLSIQAFEPVITSGKAIRLHPLVTPSFNADFDGDQMSVHVPLSRNAKKEARELMLSKNNILGLKDGKLILSPSQDIILGMYFLTKFNNERKENGKIFGSINEVKNLLLLKELHIHSMITLPLKTLPAKFKNEIEEGYKYFTTTVGRILINNVLPKDFIYVNDIDEDSFKKINKKYLSSSISEVNNKVKELENSFSPFKKTMVSKLIEKVFKFSEGDISDVLDEIKNIGFEYSMISGASMGWKDIVNIEDREQIIQKGDKKVKELQWYADEGFITDDERYSKVLDVWKEVKDEIQEKLGEILKNKKENSLFMMMDSGARGNISNFVQLAGLRGLMSKAAHEYVALSKQGIIVRNTEEIPIKSSFKSGLTPFEYFLSTHGARKGLSDTATKTAESGYLTRRLVDAIQDIMITEDDCKTNVGFKVKDIIETSTGSVIESLRDRIFGRYLSNDLYLDDKLIAKRNTLINDELADKIVNENIKEVYIRSIFSCNSHRGVCKKCYGLDLSTNEEVNIGEAIGIISAQSIGEPGTQLTMRTFHTGGVAGVTDITQGFSRLMELVDANKNPKSPAIISKSYGKVISIDQYENDKKINLKQNKVVVQDKDEIIDYIVDSNQTIRINVGDEVWPGRKITEGSIQLHKLLEYAGIKETQKYLIKEIQKLYRIQGIEIADKYMEVIIKQMLSKVQVIDPGDSKFYSSQIISEAQLREENRKIFKNNKRPIDFRKIILGVKPLPLHSESFLAAASYQRTAEVLVNSSISRRVDKLFGIKESLIVGKKIPVGTGLHKRYGKYDILEEKEELEMDDYYASKTNRVYDSILEIIEKSNDELEKVF